MEWKPNYNETKDVNKVSTLQVAFRVSGSLYSGLKQQERSALEASRWPTSSLVKGEGEWSPTAHP